MQKGPWLVNTFTHKGIHIKEHLHILKLGSYLTKRTIIF